MIIITFNRPNAFSNFNSYNIVLQVANGNGYSVIGGSLQGDLPDIYGDGFNASQLGPHAESFSTELVAGVPRNASVNKLIEGTFEFKLFVPEPTTVGLLTAGALLILGQRRRK